jgi:hypothetical protein
VEKSPHLNWATQFLMVAYHGACSSDGMMVAYHGACSSDGMNFLQLLAFQKKKT